VTSPAVIAGLAGAVTTAALTVLVAVFRYVFSPTLVTQAEVNRIEEDHRERDAEIMECLEDRADQLDEIEELILGSEYQVSDGMLEVVQANESDIRGVERIQLRIQRRQHEHTGGEDMVDKSAGDEDLPPK
jgi:hypothetical protein